MIDKTETTLNVIELLVENFKRVKTIRIRPPLGSCLVPIGGSNGAGKTTILDAMETTLGGMSKAPMDPIRHGSRSARIVVDLGEIIVERTFNARGSQLEVRGKDGTAFSSPQKVLDSLCAKISFDPAAFCRETPKKQDEILKSLLDLDFSALDEQRKALFEERARVNKQTKQLEARVTSLPQHAGVPEAEVVVSELLAQLEAHQATHAANTKVRAGAKEARSHAGQHEITVERLRNELAALERQLEKALVDQEAAGRAADEAEAACGALVDPDMGAIREQIKSSEETNRKVRENQQRAELEGQLTMAEERSRALTEAIQGIDEQKQTQLAAAKFPIPGLGFDDSGVILNGVPLEQASGAEKLRVSVAIGAALNPRVKVLLVRDGSLLDDNSMALLAQIAEETGSQVWVERVSSTGEGCAVIIEDGSVKEASAQAEAAAS